MAPAESSGIGHTPDKSRLCPVCRMEISTMATKCRFCGTMVNRPKEPQRRLTVKDLGGDVKDHFTVASKSVMDAFEAFRKAEAPARHETQEETASPSVGRGLGIPLLLDDLLAMSEAQPAPEEPGPSDPPQPVNTVTSPDSTLRAAPPPPAAPPQKMEPTTPKTESHPPDSDGALLSALGDAARHQLRVDSPVNRQVLEEIRGRTARRICDLLGQEPFSPEFLAAASDLAQKACDIDPCVSLEGLRAQVDEECRLYAMKLQEIDMQTAPPTARIQVGGSRDMPQEILVRKGDTVLDDRFKITRIRMAEVHLTDLKRSHRKLRLAKVVGLVAMGADGGARRSGRPR